VEGGGVNFSLTLPAMLAIPLVGIVLIALGTRPKATALWVSLLNLIPGFLASGVVLRTGELLFGPDPIPAREVFPVKFMLGMDGLSLSMVWLTLIVTLTAIGSAREGIKREKEYYICLLLIGLGALGAFISVDLFYFFSFHEVALIPTFLLVGMWGHGDRSGAAWRMTVYLMLGSMVLLVGLIGLYLALPETARSLDWRVLAETLRANPLSPGTQHVIAALLLIGFGTLVSLVPFHSWAPGGYASAPAPAAMLHAGVLKKFGLYGLLRVALPMTPDGWKEIGWIVGLLLAGNILYLGLASLQQRDFRWLLGFSSAMHMGTVFLGLISGTVLGLAGALTLMVGHGLSAALGFAVAGEISRRTGTSWMRDLGGLAQRTPQLWFYLMIAAMASIGLPGLANFAGEIMIFFGAWTAHPVLVGIAAWGVVLSAVAMLRAVRAIAFGPMSQAVEVEGVSDLQGARETWPFAVLTLALLLVGIIPLVVYGPAQPVLERLLVP
jgi:NADH-quinone oxidoreductase subunit M